MTTMMVNLIGLSLIALIIWWFLIKKTKATNVRNQKIEIIVKDGIYQPSEIKAQSGEEIHLSFIRKDPTPCAEMVLFDALDISSQLPVNEAKEIKLPALKPGKYEFNCQMGMYRGRLVVQ